MAVPFEHPELATTGLAGATMFYAEPFDWQLDEVPGMDRTLIKAGDGAGGT